MKERIYEHIYKQTKTKNQICQSPQLPGLFCGLKTIMYVEELSVSMYVAGAF
jgi:hypothetical protein